MCNVGTIDKIIRIIVALGLFTAAALTPFWWLAIIGVIALGTALMGFCPLYTLLHLNTGCKAKVN